MMNFKKYLIVATALIVVFVIVGAASARLVVDKGDKRVIAHTEEEVNKAVALGCKVVREAKTLKALSCPQGVAESLSLAEDVKVFSLDDEEVGVLRGPQPSATSANANQQIGADIVHASGNTGSSTKVVVLDTGYNYSHPELSSSYLGGKDFVNNDNDPMDDQGHGSHVAGIITADGIDPKAKGVAPDAGVIAGKVLNQNGSGYFSDVVAAIYWAIDGPDGIYGTVDDFDADAINMSLGTGAPYVYRGFCNGILPDLTNAIKYAIDRNVTVVVAAGNSGGAGVSIPGCISYSTTVGAVNSSDQIASFSGRGNALDITAPGVNIYSSVLGSAYATWSGTSMATPMVAGVIALIKNVHSAYTQSQVESKLFYTAKDLGKTGKDKDYGWGRVRANIAVQ
ncbi:MAG: S8 family serine peptidase [bacterium]|nr:S8 family serine peptidase [bacterium]